MSKSLNKREIEFRAWRLKKPLSVDRLGMVYFGLTSMDEDLVLGNGGMGYIDQETEVMQYTGLKDKNGKEIYEGDIISDGQMTFTVDFGNGEFYLKNTDSHHISLRMSNTTLFFEVIGNIYENPELLKEKRDVT